MAAVDAPPRRVALITGAARGIGLAYAQRLAGDGFDVVVVDLHGAEEAAAALPGPGSHLGVTTDLTDPAAIDALRARVEDRFGRVDVVVNNAAVFPSTTLDTIDLATWRRVQSTNVESALLVGRAFIDGMRRAGWGRIVNTGSANTLLHGRDLAYIVSKGAIHALTRALANELGDAGITVNAIAPSVVATEGFTSRSRSGGPSAQQVQDRVVAQQSIPRAGTPQDLVGMLAFLVSDDAAFITGQILHVDGGLTRSGA